MTKGRVHSIQSLGTVDGPGVRFVLFMQGCPLRCCCCHNPDTWDHKGGKEYTPEEIVERVKRYKEYFGEKGGITVSGGEPLLQPEFVYELFSLCHSEGINTCLDTSGCLLDDNVKKLLTVTDRVLLDIKYTNDELYRLHVGCGYKPVIAFLNYLDEQLIPTTVRQVVIPNINTDDVNYSILNEIRRDHSCVDKIELLPFKKICQVKYDSMGIVFPFADIKEPSADEIKKYNGLLSK